AGGVVLTLQNDSAGGLFQPGAMLVILACLCWAIDNNITRKISASDPVRIASLKGLVAGAVNLTIALTLGNPLPPLSTIGGEAIAGLGVDGVSLVLFLLAVRYYGAALSSA